MRQVGGGQVCDTGEHRLTAEIKGAGKSKRRRWAEIKIKTKTSKKNTIHKEKKTHRDRLLSSYPHHFLWHLPDFNFGFNVFEFYRVFFVYFQLIFKWRFKF